MTISEEHIKAASVCIASRIPFSLVIKPGDDSSTFFATKSDGEAALNSERNRFKPGFFATFFGDSPSEAVYIPADLEAEEILDPSFAGSCAPMPASEMTAVEQSTDFMKYCSSLRSLIGSLKKDRGKTVISRIIAVRSTAQPLDVFTRYVSQVSDSTFRFIFYTPATGIWIGASPELLLSHEYGSGRYSTLSLAGTRRCDEGEWDAKNQAEHDFVTDYIDFHFRNHGLDVDIQSSVPVVFGSIEHLCEKIEGRGETDPISLLDDLNPTPALCGFPVEQAFTNILMYEMHDRKCYGGMLGVADDNGFSAYVNLRSCLAVRDADGSCVYDLFAGGGITAESDPLTEWNEAAAKASMLYSSINDGKPCGSGTLSFSSYDEAFTSAVSK